MERIVRSFYCFFILGIVETACYSQPFYEIEQEILASDGANSDHFGLSVAIDGGTLAIGAEFSDVGGAVYVYVKSGPSWTFQQKVIPDDPTPGKQFGRSVALQGDTLAVGAQGDSSLRGAVYAFTRSGSTWTQQGKMVPSDAEPAKFVGKSVALDGDTIVAGANGGQSATTSVPVFVRNAGVWTEQALLRASDESVGDVFGDSVALDGDTVVIGATGDDPPPGGHRAGSVYVFVRSGVTWSEEQKLVPSDSTADDHFGSAVDIEGDTALIGAKDDDDVFSNSGSAYLFARTGSTWNEIDKLEPGDPSNGANFGTAVDIQGATATIGAVGALVGGVQSGAAYVFEDDGGGWVEHQKLFTQTPQSNDEFGFSIAFDGTTLLVGDRQDPFPLRPGAAYTFVRTAGSPPVEPVPPTPTPTPTPEPSTEVSDWKLYD